MFYRVCYAVQLAPFQGHGHETMGCDPHQILCDKVHGGKCVDPNQICNGQRDCEDGTDERPMYCTDL